MRVKLETPSAISSAMGREELAAGIALSHPKVRAGEGVMKGIQPYRKRRKL